MMYLINRIKVISSGHTRSEEIHMVTYDVEAAREKLKKAYNAERVLLEYEETKIIQSKI